MRAPSGNFPGAGEQYCEAFGVVVGESIPVKA